MNEINIVCRQINHEESSKKICIEIENEIENDLMYKFLIGIDGKWNTLQDFSSNKEVIWEPEFDGNYIIMIQAKKECSKKSFEYISKVDYSIGENIEEYITNIHFEKRELEIGEKVHVTVEAAKTSLLYRYWIRINENWQILKDYSPDNTFIYTTKECGTQELLVECKEVDSVNSFDDFKKIKFDVLPVKQLEIKDFKCLNSDLIVNEELTFKVYVEQDNNRTVLFKFVKIEPDGNVVCIQDFCTKGEVTYTHAKNGEYKLLCLVKDMYSTKEYDDRAVMNYTVKSYKPIIINSFISDLSSPQFCGNDIQLKADVSGGNKLLYRYKITGTVNEDSGYIESDTYLWETKEPGDYKIEFLVKDESCIEDCEAFEVIEFSIDEVYFEEVKIEDIVLDKNEKILKNQVMNIQVKACGGIELKYSFLVLKDNKVIEKIDYNNRNCLEFIQRESGQYKLEIRVKDKYSKKDYDCHCIMPIEVCEYIPSEIDYILTTPKVEYIVGDYIEFELIFHKTKDTLSKYEMKINGRSVEEIDYSEDRKYGFKPKCTGVYTFQFYSKNIKSTKEYDDKKEINILVNEALPITNTRILSDKTEVVCNEVITLKAACDGGKDVLYEFYLMENGEWNLIQKYSKKNYYSFMPFKNDNYKVLVLTKSRYKKISYEDFYIFELNAYKQRA